MTERKHALLSASGASRWTACTPSARWEDELPDSTSDYAAEGTLAHEYVELHLKRQLRGAFTQDEFIQKLDDLEKREHWSSEIISPGQEFIEYVKGVQIGFPEAPYTAVELRVDFSHIAPEGFGTADVVLAGSGILHVIDFKFGKGVPVAAENNLQMALYALGALRIFDSLYAIHTVRMTIHQPRLDNVDMWEVPVTELTELGEWVKQRADLAYRGEGEFVPGDHCKFCRAKNICKARAQENVRLAFAADPPTPARELTLDEIGKYLQQGKQVAAWLRDLEEYALTQALAGKDVPGWKAVTGRGSRSWTDEDQAFTRLMDSGIDEAMLYERKAISLAASEKLVGKKAFTELVGDLVVKSPGKPTLVQESDKRPAVTAQSTAAEAFGEKQ